MVARIESNTCGPGAVQAPGSAEFEVEIRRQGETGWWIPEGLAPVMGVLDDRGTFEFAVSGQIAVRAEDPVQGLAPCSLDKVDEVRGTIVQGPADEADAAPEGGAATLAAEEALSFGATSGSDCSDQLGVGTGQFLALPCQVRYSLEGAELVRPEPSS